MLQTLQQAPFLRLLIPFIVGIGFQYTFYCPSIYFIALGIVALLLLLSSFIPSIQKAYTTRWVFGLAVTFLCFSGAGILTSLSLSYSDWSFPPNIYTYNVQLLDEPVMKSRNLCCKVDILNVEFEKEWYRMDKKAIVYLPLDDRTNSLHAGNCIELTTIFRKPENFANGSSFDYAAYLKKQGYAATAYVSQDQWQSVAYISGFFSDFKYRALKWRLYLLAELRQLVPKDKSYSIAAAMMLGYKDALDKDLRTSFASVGASHVLAVSGLHTGILYGILYFIFSFLGKSRKMRCVRQLHILPLMWIFAFLTGLSPSVVRSTIMLSFVGIADITNQRSLILNTVGASAFFMLLYNPLYLFDVGFQLSYIAVFSIVIIHPLLNGLVESKYRILQYIWNLLSISTSAQIGTVPLTLYYFHQFPLVFLLTNLFVIPLSGLLLVLISGSLVFYVLLPCPSWVFYPLNEVLDFFIYGVEQIEKIPYAVIPDLPMDGMGVFMGYLVIFAMGLSLLRRKVVYLYLSILLVVFQVIYYL